MQPWLPQVHRDLTVVRDYVRRWGIPLVLSRPLMNDRLHVALHATRHSAPLTRGAVWWPREPGGVPFIEWAPSDHDPLAALALLHELSHCVVGTYPETTDEVTSGMLAFEYLSCRRLKLRGWTDWMEEYMHENKEWPFCSPKERGKALRQSFEGTVAAGLFTPDRQPTYIRKELSACNEDR